MNLKSEALLEALAPLLALRRSAGCLLDQPNGKAAGLPNRMNS